MSAAQVGGAEQSHPQRTPRVGVLVVAYNAASTLERTLSRLPESFAKSVDHVMVCDDASIDDTYEIGLRLRDSASFPMTVVKHERNLGYGGNQKAGYRWAIEHGLDVVVLLHGDGQYAPECIEDLVAPLVSGDADAVFGSRMLEKGGARAGGMPAYKFVGNRILTRLAEPLTGLHLSRVAQRLPRLPCRHAQRPRPCVVLRRLRLRHRDHPGPRPRGEAHHRGADPHLLRRRDLLRQRHGVREGRDGGRRAFRWANHRGFGGGVSATDTDLYALKATPRTGCCSAGSRSGRASRVLDAGCVDGGFAELARRLGHHVTGLDRPKYDGGAERVNYFIQADLNRGCLLEQAGATTSWWRVTSSST